jgi:small nuclear ribonucleoprotein (snRNP)-like protein
MDELLDDRFFIDIHTYAALIGSNVQIECIDQRNYTGRVYTIDPITQRFDKMTHAFLVITKNRNNSNISFALMNYRH